MAADSGGHTGEMGGAAMSRCKSCQAEIKWARTAAGKNIPLDIGVVTSGGNVRHTGEWAGPFMVVEVVAVGEGDRVSHFATCPNAKEHRR